MGRGFGFNSFERVNLGRSYRQRVMALQGCLNARIIGERSGHEASDSIAMRATRANKDKSKGYKTEEPG
jgi:hypothetical protein